jgi:ElaB/YqjD/DUF883 family membrane-anchored ribosome-binding protein
MTGNERTLNQLKHDAAKSRMDLTNTVDELKSKVTSAVDDIRDRISPDSIKAAAGDYFRSRGDQLVQKARENPLQAAAVGVGLAYPVMRILRTIPAPVLMIGAGLFLMGSKSGKKITHKAAGVASDLVAQVAVGADSMKRTLHDTQDSASHAIASAKAMASTAVDNLAKQSAKARAAAMDASGQLSETGSAFVRSASDSGADLKQKIDAAAGNAPGAIRDRVSAATTYVQDTVGSAAVFSASATRQVHDGAIKTSQNANDFIDDIIQQNPLIVGGIGLAMGALIASALPRTDAEATIMGVASAGVQKRANDMASRGFDAAKGVAANVISDVAQRADEQGLTPDGLSDAARDLGRRARQVVENATTTAFELANDKTTTSSTSSTRGRLL